MVVENIESLKEKKIMNKTGCTLGISRREMTNVLREGYVHYWSLRSYQLH